MSSTMTINTSVLIAGKTKTSQSILTDEGLIPLIDAHSEIAVTNKEYTLNVPYARLKGLVIWCNKHALFEFNNSTTGVPSIELGATGGMFVFDSSQPYASPFTADLTKVYVTTEAGYDLVIAGIFDPTP